MYRAATFQKGMTIDELNFCREYAITGNAALSARRVYSHHNYEKAYQESTLVHKLLRRKDILDKIEQFRKSYFDKYGQDLGDEVMARARKADDKDAFRYYKQAMDIMGVESPKKSETKEEKILSIPAHDVGQLEADITVEAEDVKQLEEGSEESKDV